MKFYLLGFCLFLFKLCIAQNYSEHNILIIDTGYAPLGATFIQSVDIGNTYYNPQKHLEELITKIKKADGNVARIVSEKYRKKKKEYIGTVAEIFKAANPRDVKVVTEKEYIDSLTHTLLNDTTKESIVIIYSSPTAYSNQPESTHLSFESNTNEITDGCFLNKTPSVCSFVAEKEIQIYFRIDNKRYYTLDMKPGSVYFIEFTGGLRNNAFKPVSFLYGYRTCSLYQKYNTMKRN